MSTPITVTVIIPVLNEENGLARVLESLPRDGVRDVIVVDNGSTDRSVEVARAGGATVIQEPRRGYGRACLSGLDRAAVDPPDIVVFLDGDFSDDPREMPLLVEPIARGEADFVVGSRVRGERAPGALLPQAIVGNWIATRLIGWLFGFRYTDLGPFRAIRWSSLSTLGMADEAFGWTVEMQIKALQHGLRVVEVPVRYRSRIGVSKISGTLTGSIKAGWTILRTIARYARSR